MVGVLCDILYALLRPAVHYPLRFHGFNVLIALSLWATFYAFVFLTGYGNGIWYTPYVWMGSITQAMTTAPARLTVYPHQHPTLKTTLAKLIMHRFIFLLSFFLLLSITHAHSGFNTLAWQEGLGNYTLTVLEDFHASDGSQSQLFVQLSQSKQAAPATTKVDVNIQQGNKTIYQGEVPFVANGSDDGKTFFRGYLLTLHLEEAGVYQIDVNVSGPLGPQRASYFVQGQREAISVLEVLPSLLILLISLGGAALLFIPIKRKDADEVQDKPTLKSANVV